MISDRIINSFVSFKDILRGFETEQRGPFAVLNAFDDFFMEYQNIPTKSQNYLIQEIFNDKIIKRVQHTVNQSLIPTLQMIKAPSSYLPIYVEQLNRFKNNWNDLSTRFIKNKPIDFDFEAIKPDLPFESGQTYLPLSVSDKTGVQFGKYPIITVDATPLDKTKDIELIGNLDADAYRQLRAVCRIVDYYRYKYLNDNTKYDDLSVHWNIIIDVDFPGLISGESLGYPFLLCLLSNISGHPLPKEIIATGAFQYNSNDKSVLGKSISVKIENKMLSIEEYFPWIKLWIMPNQCKIDNKFALFDSISFDSLNDCQNVNTIERNMKKMSNIKNIIDDNSFKNKAILFIDDYYELINVFQQCFSVLITKDAFEKKHDHYQYYKKTSTLQLWDMTLLTRPNIDLNSILNQVDVTNSDLSKQYIQIIKEELKYGNHHKAIKWIDMNLSENKDSNLIRAQAWLYFLIGKNNKAIKKIKSHLNAKGEIIDSFDVYLNYVIQYKSYKAWRADERLCKISSIRCKMILTILTAIIFVIAIINMSFQKFVSFFTTRKIKKVNKQALHSIETVQETQYYIPTYDMWRIHLLKANIFENLGDYEHATDELRIAINLCPTLQFRGIIQMHIATLCQKQFLHSLLINFIALFKHRNIEKYFDSLIQSMRSHYKEMTMANKYFIMSGTYNMAKLTNILSWGPLFRFSSKLETYVQKLENIK